MNSNNAPCLKIYDLRHSGAEILVGIQLLGGIATRVGNIKEDKHL